MFRVLALYTTTVESDHVLFADVLLAFFTKVAAEKNFQFDATTDGRPVSLNERTASPVRSTVAS